jgi:hypothetical protein
VFSRFASNALIFTTHVATASVILANTSALTHVSPHPRQVVSDLGLIRIGLIRYIDSDPFRVRVGFWSSKPTRSHKSPLSCDKTSLSVHPPPLPLPSSLCYLDLCPLPAPAPPGKNGFYVIVCVPIPGQECAHAMMLVPLSAPCNPQAAPAAPCRPGQIRNTHCVKMF